MAPSSCYSGPSVISSPRVWAGPTTSCPVNRIQQKWWDVISKVGLLTLEMVAAVLLSLPLARDPLSLMKPLCPEMCCGESNGKKLSPVFRWFRSSTERSLGTRSCQNPRQWPGKLILPQGGLEIPEVPAHILTAAWEGPWARGASEATPRILSHRNWQIIDVVLCN